MPAPPSALPLPLYAYSEERRQSDQPLEKPEVRPAAVPLPAVDAVRPFVEETRELTHSTQGNKNREFAAPKTP